MYIIASLATLFRVLGSFILAVLIVGLLVAFIGWR